MLLEITTTAEPATDLGYLLHKNPTRVQSFDLAFGKAHVFYPEATPQRCTAALLLDVDPVALVRTRRGPAGEGGLLEQYVNDRPYVASSFLSVALAQVFSSALAGTSRDRPELAVTPIPLRARLCVVPCRRGGEDLLRRLFEPLGYAVTARRHVRDERFPAWGDSPYLTVEIEGRVRLRDLLRHLYVLVPVLDDNKHYWIGDDEVDKLLRHAGEWLAAHPVRDQIVERYLKRSERLTRLALARLRDDAPPEEDGEDGEEEPVQDAPEAAVERPLSLNEQRLASVLAALRASGARRILDLGCGEGKLLRLLLREKEIAEIVGIDVSSRALEVASRRLRLENLPPRQRERIKLIHGSLTYRDMRFHGFDAAAAVEVIEHLDPPRLAAFERVVFEHAQPRTVVLTTPNAEYNVKFESLAAGQFRHADHRFEWRRDELRAWCERIALRFGYQVRYLPVGPVDELVGSPTQMAIFTRAGHG